MGLCHDLPRVGGRITADLRRSAKSEPPRDTLRPPGREPVGRVALAGSPEALRGQQRARLKTQPLGAGADAVLRPARSSAQLFGEAARTPGEPSLTRCSSATTKDLAYVVTSEGGIGGAGETLRAVPPEHLRFEKNDVAVRPERRGMAPACHRSKTTDGRRRRLPRSADAAASRSVAVTRKLDLRTGQSIWQSRPCPRIAESTLVRDIVVRCTASSARGYPVP